MFEGLQMTGPGHLAARVTGLSAAVALAAALSGCMGAPAQPAASSPAPGHATTPPTSQSVTPGQRPHSPAHPAPPAVHAAAPHAAVQVLNSLPRFTYRGVSYSVSGGNLSNNHNQGVVVINGRVCVDDSGTGTPSARGAITVKSQDGRGDIIFHTSSGDTGVVSVAGHFGMTG